jgi:endonuclease/exonuclease/phosphatase family metal-dependent hydrolase
MWGRSGPWEQRWALAARLLKALDPDVICVQEAVAEIETLGLPVAAFEPSSALAVLTRLKVRSTRMQDLGRSPIEPTPRQALRVDFEDWSLANTHLAWQQRDGASRRMQSAVLASEAPTVLCGDLNATWGTADLAPLQALGLIDALRGRPHAARPTWDNRNPHTLPYRDTYPDQRLDYILTTRSVRDARIVLDEPDADGLYPSDHFGVMAEISV